MECAEKRVAGKGEFGAARNIGGLVGKLAGKAAKAGKIGKGKNRGKSGGAGKSKGKSKAVAETVKKHKPDCECATCTLLKSI